MGIRLGAGFDLHGPQYLDSRVNQAKTLDDLKNWSTPLPPGFEVFLESEGSWYTYDPSTINSTTGNFKKRTTGSGSGEVGGEDIERLDREIIRIDGEIDKIYEELSAERRAEARIEISNLTGSEFLGYEDSITISCTVLRGWIDIIDEVTSWSIVRNSGDSIEDAAWNLSNKALDFKGEITFYHGQEVSDIGQGYSTSFLITAQLGTKGSATYEITV